MQWRGRTALILASEGGHLDVVRELLRAQADVNVQDEVMYVKYAITAVEIIYKAPPVLITRR